MKPYRKENIPRAKELRKNMTPWERKLWYLFLRNYTPRFQRQKAIGNYIVDFYCSKARLVLELDGGGHYEKLQQEYDERRTTELEKEGLRLIRICNLDIDGSFDAVCEMIDREVQSNLSLRHHAVTPPSSEGGEIAILPRRRFAPSSEGGERS